MLLANFNQCLIFLSISFRYFVNYILPLLSLLRLGHGLRLYPMIVRDHYNRFHIFF